VKAKKGVEGAVGVGVALPVLRSPVLVAKAKHHQKQDRDMCLEVLPDPYLAPQVAALAVAIRNLRWKLMDIKKVWIMLHHVIIIIIALKHLAFSKCPVGLPAAPTASRQMVNLLTI